MQRALTRAAATGIVAALALACSRPSGTATTTSAGNEPISQAQAQAQAEPPCHLVKDGYGPAGTVRLTVTRVVTGLVVPWSIAFLPGGDLLVSERAGRIRLVRDRKLASLPVATVAAATEDEGGLLGLALHPAFPENKTFFAYYTAKRDDGSKVNRIARYVLEGDRAREDRIVYDGIPAAQYHDGGRIRFGADGMLYAGTGDSRSPDLAQDPKSPAGKLLRLTPDGAIPKDNPRPGSPAFLTGIRNLEAFDWLDDGRIVLADHGPSGELGRRGHDEVSVAGKGGDLGWPGAWACERKRGVVTPMIVFEDAMPPGGGVLYRGDAIPAFKGSFVVGTLGSKHLHRFVLDPKAPRVVSHEVYFEGDPPSGLGRLRDVVTGPDGALWVTTSNCDGRGTCPPTKDAVLRITAAP